MLARSNSTRDRYAMYNTNKLKIGFFGSNCSSGRAVTMVPERWSGSWPDNLKLARMADDEFKTQDGTFRGTLSFTAHMLGETRLYAIAAGRCLAD